ncbi:MAG: Lysophospholipase, alpha-beta hydrolase superfamily [Chloroflexi bacterium AL-W]|nr:Lysophospholipase, alpha-beta hydrolase superfamily [Chloroflexi bacterium AL-N1]NOK69737.1 Lysophospholipase, alpha-beta hydrolase superfamily [Chloroflexi bacterium AL-N10]NOK73659.1 Lysophospholipase, alpha-beta hydrolase superfamily [Chloroflexi bacterium AL-N5]NOK83907.1 Lysophospholipase, alpha-beta hydrolase superfamily [Chloroflexi bacterium AL-W]NOK87990.1 Lysophospholipase, alpha-beta hydrolase superfamily [Chloroflexi bacterium AL-N15]
MWLKRLGYSVLLLLSVPLGWLGSVSGFFALAFITDMIPLLLLSGVLVSVLLTGWLSWSACHGLFIRPLLQRGLPVIVTGGTLFVVGVITSVHVFQPMAITYVPKESTFETVYWDLPTGSRLAYIHIPAEGTAHPTPVILLHGGPGASSNFTLQPEDQRLASAGFNVYLYDQVGSGLSERLDDITQYTVDRHVADLEAIRQEIDAESMILVGGSWGGTLAAHYLAAHPERVEKVVFSSPGAIWTPAFAEGEIETGSSGNASSIVAEFATLRWVVAYALQQINPTAAQNLVSDREMSAFFQQIVGHVIASDVADCDTQDGVRELPTVSVIPQGFGYYANMMTVASMSQTADPRPVLVNSKTSVLILRGECDRIRPEVHQEYREIFTYSTLFVVDDVGHAVNRSPQYADILSAFLLEQPLLLEPYQSEIALP